MFYYSMVAFLQEGEVRFYLNHSNRIVEKVIWNKKKNINSVGMIIEENL